MLSKNFNSQNIFFINHVSSQQLFKNHNLQKILFHKLCLYTTKKMVSEHIKIIIHKN